MKQVLETIMVFQKGTKNKSVLDDVFDYENGDTTISPSLWAIDEGRVPTSDSLDGGATSSNNAVVSKEGFDRPWMHDEEKLAEHKLKMQEKVKLAQASGRYPSQLLIDEACAKALDEQSGELTSGARKSSYTRRGKNPNETYGKFNAVQMDDAEKDSGGASRVLHTIGYMDSELDIAIYSSKVSTKERSAGTKEYELSESIDDETLKLIKSYTTL